MRRSEGSLVRGRCWDDLHKNKSGGGEGGAAGALSVLGVGSLFCHYGKEQFDFS